MRRISYRFFRFISAVTYWANRRFTAAGALVISATVMTGALGVDTTQSAAYQAFGFLAALLAAAALCLPLLRARVHVERELPRVATAGEPFTYRVRVSNSGAAAVEYVKEPLLLIPAGAGAFLATWMAVTRERNRELRRLDSQ